MLGLSSVGPCFIFLRQGRFMCESSVEGSVDHGVQFSNMLFKIIKYMVWSVLSCVKETCSVWLCFLFVMIGKVYPCVLINCHHVALSVLTTSVHVPLFSPFILSYLPDIFTFYNSVTWLSGQCFRVSVCTVCYSLLMLTVLFYMRALVIELVKHHKAS